MSEQPVQPQTDYSLPKEPPMPLWQIHHPSGAYTTDDKRAFARDVTAFYEELGLPRFYVVVLFHEVDESSFLVGGESSASTVRIVIAHIARHVTDPDHRRRTAETINAITAPYTIARGFTPEFHVDESPRDQWMINGIVPPPGGSDAEKAWAEADVPFPY